VQNHPRYRANVNYPLMTLLKTLKFWLTFWLISFHIIDDQNSLLKSNRNYLITPLKSFTVQVTGKDEHGEAA
jgi:hypothetical protein